MGRDYSIEDLESANYLGDQRLVNQMRELVRNFLPPEATVIVVSKGDEELLELDGRRGWHFPQNEEGVYAGYYPADSAEAIAQLEELRAKGGEFLLFPSAAFWWLEHYGQFRQHLEHSYRRVVQQEELCLVFDLRERQVHSELESQTATEDFSLASTEMTTVVYPRPELPPQIKPSDSVPLARGGFDRIVQQTADEIFVSGWMLLPDRDFDSIQIFLNGQPCGSTDIKLREDRARAHGWIPHGGHSGFQFILNKSMVETDRINRIDLLGCKDKRTSARMSTLFRMDIDEAVPTPPPKLMMRVAATQDAHLFKLGGIKCFGDFLESICQHGNFHSGQRLLDWGCGCGRVTGHFLLVRDGPEVLGCDIDDEATKWCTEHLSPGKFTTINPWPPTPYEDASFDLIVGYSVFTHLAREAQNAWLAEMRRIITPGGLFLASTHGDFAALFAFPKTLKTVLADGIFDERLDPYLDGIAPEGYYRSVYQTREYTYCEWSKYFEILEYVERGIGNYQDLVVMRRST